jgi:hypothetical protein
MDTETLGKRSFTSPNDKIPGDAKRPCHPESPVLPSPLATTPPEFRLLQRLLSVPLEIILRQVESSSAPKRPLLSRMEAQCLLFVDRRAREMDALTLAAMQTLERKTNTQTLAATLEAANHPYFRSLLPILWRMDRVVTVDELRRVRSQTAISLLALDTLAQELGHQAEQNWEMASTLQEAPEGTAGHVLSGEKYNLAIVQTEVKDRILNLLQQSPGDRDILQETSETMHVFCEQTFGVKLSQDSSAPETLANSSKYTCSSSHSKSLSTDPKTFATRMPGDSGTTTSPEKTNSPPTGSTRTTIVGQSSALHTLGESRTSMSLSATALSPPGKASQGFPTSGQSHTPISERPFRFSLQSATPSKDAHLGQQSLEFLTSSNVSLAPHGEVISLKQTSERESSSEESLHAHTRPVTEANSGAASGMTPPPAEEKENQRSQKSSQNAQSPDPSSPHRQQDCHSSSESPSCGLGDTQTAAAALSAMSARSPWT